MKKEAINKQQQFLIALYKDFEKLDFDEEEMILKKVAEDGFISLIGAMELLKKGNSK